MFLSTFAATISKFKSSPKFLYLSLTYTSIAITRHFKSSVTHYPKSNAVSPISIVINHLKNDRIDEAEALFEKINSCDVKLCSVMITGYTQNGRLNDALKLFYEMRNRDVVCWNSIVKGCLDCGDLDMGMKLFDEMPERNVISWTTILNGFLQFGRIEMAECLFDRMPYKDIAAWNSMIHGYCCSGRVEDAMMLFRRMPRRNVISWTSMISGLDQYGKYREALYLFGEMLASGVEPTSSTYCCVIAACGNHGDLHLGSQIHADIVKFGYHSDRFLSASLITFYANCRQIESSCKVFNENFHINVVAWTALVTGYGLNGKHGDALKVVSDMVRLGIFPNQHTFTSALNSCCDLEAIERGKEIHTAAIKLGLDTDVFVGNSLVVMYSTCGDVSDGIVAFRKTRGKNTVSWNSIIVGCAQHGCGMLALIFFRQMLRAEVEPDPITFTGLLSACGHSGMLEKGRSFFEYLMQCRATDLKPEHYACMVDILGRAGKLEEAEDLVNNMPMNSNSMVWLALLSACRTHSNTEMAERAAEKIFDLDPHCSAAYVLLSNLYASQNRWSDVSRIRVRMKWRRIIKQPGCSWVTLKGMRHEFLSGDRSHPLSKKIYEKLDWLGLKLKKLGYIPDQSFALHDVEDEQKEEMLAYHSERLAIGFALVSTVEGSRITVMKNLRVCGDCHSVIKLIAKIVRREIVVRDTSRFHHFWDGVCSCGDYW